MVDKQAKLQYDKTVKTQKVLSVFCPRGCTADPLHSRIIQVAREYFLSRGFIRVTCDEIADRLGISKATLYKSFSSKEAILRAVVQEIMGEIVIQGNAFIEDGQMDFVEKLVALFSFVGTRFSLFGPLLVRDIQKHAPKIWKEIDDFRREKIIKNFAVILASGRDGGFVRSDIDIDLLLQMLVSLIQEFINPEALLRSERTPAKTFESILKVFFQGILTEKGYQGFSRKIPTAFGSLREGMI
jgi:AcrR family transcriptional regulator